MTCGTGDVDDEHLPAGIMSSLASRKLIMTEKFEDTKIETNVQLNKMKHPRADRQILIRLLNDCRSMKKLE